jgi:hypothetical protein
VLALKLQQSLEPFMLFFLMGLAISVVCAVHAYRTKQESFWMWLVLMLPLAGSFAYVLAVVLPAWQDQRRTAKPAPQNLTGQIATARSALERAPTVDNRLRLADLLLEAHQPREAASLYEAELKGNFAEDPQILNRLAEAQVASGNSAAALETLDTLKACGATLSRESELSRARALADTGQHEDAIAAYRALLPHYPGEEARGHFAGLLLSLHRHGEARAVLQELVTRGQHAPAHLQARDSHIYNWAKSKLGELG